MNITTDLASWAAVVGVLLPMLVALLQREHWGSTVNGVIFGVAVVVAAVIYQFVKIGHWDWRQWEGELLAIITWSVATFHLYWQPSGQIAAARAIPPGPSPAPPAK